MIVISPLLRNAAIAKSKNAHAVHLKRACQTCLAQDAWRSPASRPGDRHLLFREKIARRRKRNRRHIPEASAEPAFDLVSSMARTLHARVEQFCIIGIECDDARD